MRKKRLRYVILSAIAGSVLLTPAMAHNYDSYITNPREPVTYIVDGKANTMQLAKLSESDPYEDYDGKHAFKSTNIEDRFESLGAVTSYTRPNYDDADGAMSVNPMWRQSMNSPHYKVTWGPDAGNSDKDAEFNYVALQNGTTENVYTVNYPMGGNGNARLNVLEMFSGDNLSEIAAVNGARNAMQNRVILRDVGRLRDVVGAGLSNNDNGSAIDNDVFVAGGRDIDIIYGARAENTNPATGSLKNNLVTLGAGKVVTAFGAYATTRDEEESFFQGKPSTEKSKEVIGNRVQLGFNPDDKWQADGRKPATVGQIVGGFSATNKANKNTVIISEGSIGGLGMFKVKNEQSKHSVNGVDTNGIYTDEVPYGDDNTVYKYFRQPGNYYIIGGMSDVEATGNTVDINKAEPFANKQVGIWGGHYILGGSTGDIKSGNTLNVNKVKGITLSHLANFENYNFDLPENVVNGDTILTVTDSHGTDVSNTKINVGVSGAAPVLHNGDSINLIYNSNGVNTTGAQYGKLQQGVSLSYDITAKAGDDKKSVVAVVGKNTSGRPATTSTDEVTTNSLSSYTSYLVNTANSTSQPITLNAATAYRDANGKMVFTTDDIGSRIQSRGKETKYERPEGPKVEMSVNPLHEFDSHDNGEVSTSKPTTWGPELVNARGGNSAKNNYLALVDDTDQQAFTANVDGSGHAIGNVLELFAYHKSSVPVGVNNKIDKLSPLDKAPNESDKGIIGAAIVTGSGNASKNQVVIQSDDRHYSDIVGAAIIKAEGDSPNNEPNGDAVDNEVVSLGDATLETLYGAISINKNAKGTLKNNRVVIINGYPTVAYGALATVLDEDETIFKGIRSKQISKEVVGNLVQLGAGINEKSLVKGKDPATVGQIVGGYSATNKANKNAVIINDGIIGGVGVFKVKNEQKQHNINGVDANGIYTDEVSPTEKNSDRKYYNKPGNYYIIGGMSDVGATGNTVDINKAEPFANKQVGIWGGHYILDGSNGDIKSGNTLNVNKVKGITLSHLANFENYNFDLPENAVNGDTILTVTDPHGTDVSNTKINVGVSGAAPVLHNGDSINLIYNSNGVNTTGAQYGKLQQGVSLSYDITAKAGDDKKSVVAVVKNSSEETTTPEKPSTGDTTKPVTPSTGGTTDNTNLSIEPSTAYIVDAKENTIQAVTLKEGDYYKGTDGKLLFRSVNKKDRFETHGAVTKYTKPEHSDRGIGVNSYAGHPGGGIWGPNPNAAYGSEKDVEYNYLGLDNGLSDETHVVNGIRNAKYNVLEMFSGDSDTEVSATYDVVNATGNRVILRNVGRVYNVNGANITARNGGNATDNDVFVAGGRDIDLITGAMSNNNGLDTTGELSRNTVTLAAGKVATAFGAYASSRDGENYVADGETKPYKTKEVIGNVVQLGANLNDKWETEGRGPATVGQIVGGLSTTNKANKNTVIIGEGTIGGLGIFKVKNEQSNHNINGVDANGLYNDETSDDNDNAEYKYYRKPGNYYIIGGMSDVEATGNTVDINKAEPFANKQVGIWGGHYILDGSTGDIKSGNTLNVNKVKGITLSHLANFENYNFDLPENAVNGDTILTVTDPHGTDVSNTKINVGVSGAAPVLHNGDSINLIYNSNGVNTTGAQYGKLQQGVSLSYDITAKVGDDKKSVVAVVKSASEETPEKPSTGDTTKPVTPSTGDATKLVTPSTGDATKPVTPVAPSTGDTTKPVTPSTGDATKPVTPVAPSTGDTTKPVTPVTPSTGDATKPVTPVAPSTGDTTKPVTPVTPSTGDTAKPVTPVVPSTGDTTKPVTPVTPSTGDTAKPVTPVAPSTGDTAKPVTPVTPSTGDTTKPVPPVTPSTGDTTKPSTGNVSVKVLPQTKSLVETRTAVSGFINNGQDSITKAFATHTSGTSQIIAGINHDRMKVETGSYANIKGSHAVLGLGKQSGRTYWGPFLEMGWARYDSHLDSGLRAEGNAKYYGVGLYGKTTLDNGVYVESSVRAGRTNYTYESNELVTASSNVHASYDAHNSYYGAHLGLGKVMSYGNQLEGNVYANVFYSHQGEANATLTGKGLGETYAFDSVNSVRTRLGYKVSKHMSNHNTWYLGVAYEREFSGEARATVKGLSTLAPSLGGSSGLVEAGFTYGSNRDAFSATLNVEGWFGQKRGATLGGSINWKY